MVLVGVHPSLTQVPPTCSRSIRAVRHSSFSQCSGKRCTGLPGADHNGIELLRSGHKRAKIMYRNPGKCLLPEDAEAVRTAQQSQAMEINLPGVRISSR